MTLFQATIRKNAISEKKFRDWAQTQRINLARSRVTVLANLADPTRIETLRIEPDLSAADITKVLTEYPYLQEGRVRPDNSVVP